MIGAVLTVLFAAGVALFFVAREAPTLIRAWRQGVVMTRSTPPKAVHLSQEPERFRKLLNQRLASAGTGAVFLIAAIVAVALRAMGISLPSRFG